MVLLPDKDVTTTIGDPYAGSYFYHSGAGNNLDNSMTRDVNVPAGTATLSFQARYHIEACWDYAYVEVSTDGGATFHSIPTSASTNDNENGQNFGNGITGTSGTPKVCDQFGTPVWVPITADLSAYAGTDHPAAIPLLDGWRGHGATASAWTTSPSPGSQPTAPRPTRAGRTWASPAPRGRSRSRSSTRTSPRIRTYQGYDNSLQTGPYNFGFPDTKPDWVEHFPYQDGLLVWYYDTSFSDNNVGDHCLSGRCGGLFLPVDAHPDLMLRPDNGKVWRPRVQSYDSTFGLENTDKVCLHTTSTVSSCFGGLPGNPLFDDSKSYWVPPNAAIGNFGWASVPTPNTGTTIRVASTSGPTGFMQVLVNK